MKGVPPTLRARTALLWNRYKRPVKRIYQVPLIGLGYLYRRTLNKPLFVGVTGSLGKTQTKSLIAAVLTQRGSVRYDPSTDNRTYDAAKNLLKTLPTHSACLQEIGLSGPGSMERPVRLFRPDIAVITNVRSDHAEEFATRRDHVLEKASIIRNLPASGYAILNADEPDFELLAGQTNAKIISFGLSAKADVRANNIENHPPQPLNLDVRVNGATETVLTQLHGSHNAYGVLAALAVGRAAGVPLGASATAVAAVAPVRGRMEYVEHDDGVGFLLDDWKASEGSLVAITDYLRACNNTNGSNYLVLGSISYETLDTAGSYARFIDSVTAYADEILLVGPRVSKLDRSRLPDAVPIFATVRQCADYLLPRLKRGDTVVLKGHLVEDHLCRLEIMRRTTVNCWQMFCERKTFCEDCNFIKDNLD